MQDLVTATRWLALGAVALFAIALVAGRGIGVTLPFMVFAVVVVTVVALVDLVVRRR